MRSRTPLRLLLALALAGAATRASAALGEPAASISADQQTLAAARRVGTARRDYQVEQLRSSVQTVREYVSPSGVVFAVCWDGVSHPDLTALLGTYARPVHQALADARAGGRRRARRVEAAGAVVETWGHMRAVHGRAYVPSLVPAGVAIDEIR